MTRGAEVAEVFGFGFRIGGPTIRGLGPDETVSAWAGTADVVLLVDGGTSDALTWDCDVTMDE